MRAQILTAQSRQAGGDDAQQAAGVTEEPPGLEHVRDGRDSFFSSRAGSMTGVPRTPIGREDRRRWTALIPSVSGQRSFPLHREDPHPVKIIASANGCVVPPRPCRRPESGEAW